MFPEGLSYANLLPSFVVSGPGLPSYRELVAAAAEAVGATNARQLAEALGYTGRDEDKVVRNWMNGTNAPSYDGTMRLLNLAGWLQLDPNHQTPPPSRAQQQRRVRLLREARQALDAILEEE